MEELTKKVEKTAPSKGRKRKSQPDLWKRNKLKEKRYAPADLPVLPKCKHK